MLNSYITQNSGVYIPSFYCVTLLFCLGLIMSISQTCIINDKVIGIVGMDVNMADLLEDITYFEKGEESYAFLINHQGKTKWTSLFEIYSTRITESILAVILVTFRYENQLLSLSYTVNAAVSVKFDLQTEMKESSCPVECFWSLPQGQFVSSHVNYKLIGLLSISFIGHFHNS